MNEKKRKRNLCDYFVNQFTDRVTFTHKLFFIDMLIFVFDIYKY